MQIAPVAPQCMDELKKLLMAVCKNPTVPGFSHYLFESVAALIANSAVGSPETVATLEEMLFPPFQFVLQNEVQVHPAFPSGSVKSAPSLCLKADGGMRTCMTVYGCSATTRFFH